MQTSGYKRIAERYVQALFEAAADASALEAVGKDLRTLAQAIEQNQDFRHFLGNPLLSRDDRAKVLKPILDKMKAHAVTKQFIALLAQHRRLVILGEAAALFAQKLAEERGEMRAEIIAASPLSERQAKQIGSVIGKAYGKTVDLTVSEDPSLLGGVVIKIGSQQLDGSLVGKLNRLSQKLKAA